MGRVKGRSKLASDDLKKLAVIFNRSHASTGAIREILNGLHLVGEKGVSEDTVSRWMNSREHTEKATLITATFDDVMFLRERAYWATGMCEINRFMYITERAYWWGLYISALHILLRQALAIEAAAELPPQFVMPQLEQFYEDLRTFRQQTPLMEGDLESVEELDEEMKAFEKKWAKNLKLPRETL